VHTLGRAAAPAPLKQVISWGDWISTHRLRRRRRHRRRRV